MSSVCGENNHLSQLQICPDCEGTGEKRTRNYQLAFGCLRCEGTGYLDQTRSKEASAMVKIRRGQIICKACSGEAHDCEVCEGRGYFFVRERVIKDETGEIVPYISLANKGADLTGWRLYRKEKRERKVRIGHNKLPKQDQKRISELLPVQDAESQHLPPRHAELIKGGLTIKQRLNVIVCSAETLERMVPELAEFTAIIIKQAKAINLEVK
jgi:hypothetical protein